MRNKFKYPGKRVDGLDEYQIMGFIFYTTYGRPLPGFLKEFLALNEINAQLSIFQGRSKFFVFWFYSQKVFSCTKEEVQDIISAMLKDQTMNCQDITIIGEDFQHSDMLHITHDGDVFYTKNLTAAP